MHTTPQVVLETVVLANDLCQGIFETSGKGDGNVDMAFRKLHHFQ